MAPKKGKEVDSENYWRTCIEDAILNDEWWRVKVILIEAAGSDHDRIYLQKFETYAAGQRRFVIKNICKTETIFMVNQLGGEKKVKDDNLRVFEEGQVYLKEKKDIPPEMLALIIKHLILKMKEEYLFIKKQRLKVREGMKRESATMVDRMEVKGTVNIKSPDPPEVPLAPLKGKKGEVEAVSILDEDDNKKYGTMLRVRGEEWRDKVYIDDYPTDGPNLYVALTGFVEPNLAGCLIKIGIPLTAVVQIRIDPTATKVPSGLIRPTKRGQSQTELLAEKSLKYWEDLQVLRLSKGTADVYKNTAFLVFSPPYRDSDNLSSSPERIYDEICFLIYDLQDLSRQHSHYLNSMDVMNIPEEYQNDRYSIIYNKHLDGIPFESITSYLVLDSILQTVSECFDENNRTSSCSTAIILNQGVPNTKEEQKLQQSEALVKELINELCRIDCGKKKYRFTFGDEYENHKNPIVINYGDFCKYNTFHLGDINLDNIVRNMLIGMPINKLWMNTNKPSGEIVAKINFHVNVLLSCFDRTDVETAELDRLIHILACRKIYNNRSSLKKGHLLPATITEFKKKYLKRSVLAEPLSQSIYKFASLSATSFSSMIKSEESYKSLTEEDEISRIKFLFDCPDISELVSAAEIANKKPINHMIDDFEYFEDFSGVTAFQIIQDAHTKFNCVDYKYCEVTDCIVLMFYNSHDDDGIAREEWRCHLPTPLCLQDFFDFGLEEHYDWFKEQEQLYEENILIRSQSEYEDLKGSVAANACIDDSDVEMELLMEGSLKYEELANLDTNSPENTDFKTLSSKKTSTPASGTDADSKSTKKTKSPAYTNPKLIIPEPEKMKIQPLTKPFSGYDLGNRRVGVFGKDSSYFSKDGTRISSFYYLLIPMNLEYVTLNIVPGNSHNEFWMHRSIGDNIKPEVLDTCESFRIKSKDQVIICIKKETYKIPIPVAKTSPESGKHKKSSAKSPSGDSSILGQKIESRSFHSLSITWPNGLITQSVYENNSPIFSHIKQFYISPPSHLQEEMRCISLNGEVIIFNNDNVINILRPDSSCTAIKKCRKEIVIDEIFETISSVVGADNGKKGKEKDYKKPVNKASSKSLNTIIEDEKDVYSKPTEYKLLIDEFEIIEANGLRQKWINENYFDGEKLLIKTATDYCLGEVFSKRMDGTTVLLNKDGVQLVTFPNNTRILTQFIIEDKEIFPEWTEEELEYFSTFKFDTDANEMKWKGSFSQKSFHNSIRNSESSLGSGIMNSGQIKPENCVTDGYVSIHLIYTIEHPNFTTVTIDKSTETISIESPNNTCVKFNKDNNYEFLLDSRTSAKFDGENLNISYDACSECRSFTTCEVKIKSEEINNVHQMQRNWVNMKDSFCKKVIVNEEGNITNNTLSEHFIQSKSPNYSAELLTTTVEAQNENDVATSTATSHGKCNQMYEAKSRKFFILNRDLTCSELLHRGVIEQYKQACRYQPWCSINQYDTFGDHRTLWSILSPVHLNESEKWLMDSKLSDKPKNLTYKDLKNDPGKGFYHWMRPYNFFQPKPIKPDNVLPERLPRAFILRTLEQQWKEAQREELKGAKELLKAVFRYRDLMEAECDTILHLPIRDLRSEHERKTDDVVQAIAHRVYEELKNSLIKDVQSRAKANITTRPRPTREDLSVEGEMEVEEAETHPDLIHEEDRSSAVKEVESAVDMSPNLTRYWRRRAEDIKEEQFYRYLLRQGSVPPYFQNLLGGAIWWEVNKTAENAVTKAESRKIKCVCYEED